MTSLTRTLRCSLGAECPQAERIQSNRKGRSNKCGRTSLMGDDGMGFELAGRKGADTPLGVWGAASAKLEMRS